MSRRKVTGRPEKTTTSSELASPEHAERGEDADAIQLHEARSGEAEVDEAEVDEAGFEDVIAQLYADDSAALATWKDRLSGYVDGQGTLDALRLRPSSEQPWPASDNPMLGYLIERCVEMAGEDNLDGAVRWLAANAWFEGAIAERARFVRFLDAD